MRPNTPRSTTRRGTSASATEDPLYVLPGPISSSRIHGPVSRSATPARAVLDGEIDGFIEVVPEDQAPRVPGPRIGVCAPMSTGPVAEITRRMPRGSGSRSGTGPSASSSARPAIGSGPEAILGDGPADELARSLAARRARIGPEIATSRVSGSPQLHETASRASSVCLLLTGLCFDHHFYGGRDAVVQSSAIGAGLYCSISTSPIAAERRSRAWPPPTWSGLDSGNTRDGEDPVGSASWVIDAPTPASDSSSWRGPPPRWRWRKPGGEAASVQVLATIQPGTSTHRLRYGWRWTTAGRGHPGRPRIGPSAWSSSSGAVAVSRRPMRGPFSGLGDVRVSALSPGELA